MSIEQNATGGRSPELRDARQVEYLHAVAVDLYAHGWVVQANTVTEAATVMAGLLDELDSLRAEVAGLRRALATIDTGTFLHLGPGHSTLHDARGDVVAWAEEGEHVLWVELRSDDALDLIEAAQAAGAAVSPEPPAPEREA